MAKFNYRPDIDGLRAVAVLLVIFFHAGIGFPGGFVGVDIFFVISGFLITGLILKAKNEDTFTLSGFWVRRIRRILPVSTLVVATTMVAGFGLLLPGDYAELGKSAVAQQLMAANLFFCKQTNYFGGTAELKPLLHTWSLAVEEQFYLFYPLLLIFLHRFSTKIIGTVLASLAATSFLVNVWGMDAHPTATFYLLPTRAWEMLLGGVLAVLPLPRKRPKLAVNLMSLSGLTAIVASACCFDSTTCFPGVAALAPCLGASLLIFSGSLTETPPGKLLGTKPFVFVGLISYSLYLWHWPILVFMRLWIGNTPALPLRILAILTTFCLAYISWHFVETPLRKPIKGWERYFVLTRSIASTALLATASLLVVYAAGFETRLPKNFPAIQTYPSKGLALQPKNNANLAFPSLGVSGTNSAKPLFDKPQFIVWGDSHAEAIAELCSELATKHEIHGVIAAQGGHVPLLGLWRESRPHWHMPEWNQMVMNYIREHQIRNVVLASAWSVYTEGTPYNLVRDTESLNTSSSEARVAFRRACRRTISELSATGARVWIIGQCPDYEGHSLPRPSSMRDVWFGLPQNREISVLTHQQRQSTAKQAFNLDQSNQVEYLDPTPFCFDKSGNSMLFDDGGFYYVDESHVSKRGAKVLLSSIIDDVFHQVANQTVQEPPTLRIANNPE